MSDFDGNITTTEAQWADVPSASTQMRLLGGAGGPMNAQAVALVKRSNELKARADALEETTGASIIGADDGSGGSIFTKVSGFISRVMSSLGASTVGYDGGTVKDVLDSAKPMANYTALRAYTGTATSVRITTPGMAGVFYKVAAGSADDTGDDNGGTIIRVGSVANPTTGAITQGTGARWKRLFDGDMNILWFTSNGIANGIAFELAVDAAASYSRRIFFPAGSYNFSGITTPTATGVVELIGDGYDRVSITGSVTKSLVKLNGGGTFKASGIKFSTWSSVCKLNSNSGSSAFEVLEASRCWFDNIHVSSISDSGTPADGGVNQVIFADNLCTNIGQVNSTNSAALRLDSKLIYSAFVTKNEIRNVGGEIYSGQKDGISLGGVTVTSLSSVYVSGNRIYNVKNSGTDHISGITVFGRHTRVVDNSINTVQSANVSNVDQYAIYTKSSYSTIRGNTIVDAGGNAACIMTKGHPNDINGASLNALNNDNIIADNTVLISARWSGADSYVGIATYNAGMNIHDNTIEGVNIGIVKIGFVVVGGAIGRDMIHHNKIRNLSGSSAKTAVGIQIEDANRTLVESNEIRNVGSGVETAAYGIYMINTGAATLTDFTVRGNTVESVSAATASNSRAVFLSFDTSGTFSDAIIEQNNLRSAGRGIRLAFAGTVSKVHVRKNRIDSMSVDNFDYSGTAPTDSVMQGNTVDGADYITIPAGTTTPVFGGVDELKINNISPTTILYFSRAYGNQTLRLEILDAGKTTIENNSAIKLSGSANWTPLNGGMITLRRIGGVFKEVCRTAY